ncbi:unnamed protein product [Caenorhabditis auriculariae]|uniref:Uncharacterized protein n=1 Tax=Caenorhabditis auriculariae TaxID=2777116 RepID=A0A8S1HDC8_9PELO|nr:unnamed protein product [Caenorhabditis auriculariae]
MPITFTSTKRSATSWCEVSWKLKSGGQTRLRYVRTIDCPHRSTAVYGSREQSASLLFPTLGASHLLLIRNNVPCPRKRLKVVFVQHLGKCHRTQATLFLPLLATSKADVGGARESSFCGWSSFPHSAAQKKTLRSAVGWRYAAAIVHSNCTRLSISGDPQLVTANLFVCLFGLLADNLSSDVLS